MSVTPRYILCDICNRNITNKHVYPKKFGVKWIFETRRQKYDFIEAGWQYDKDQLDFCGDCWSEIVMHIKKKVKK